MNRYVLQVVQTSVVAAAMTASAAWAGESSAQKQDARYFTIQSAEVRDITPEVNVNPQLRPLSIPGGIVGPQLPGKSADDASGDKPLMVDGVDINQVVNLGKEAWAFIEKNKPVVNVKTDSANALPLGAESWSQLQGWQTPVSRTYEAKYKNFYGITVVDFIYRVTYTYGGNVEGRGQFLTNVTAEAASLNVVWGYTFNADVTVPAVTNASASSGTPLGAIQLRVRWTIDTILKHEESTYDYYVRGDGQFTDLN